MIVMSKSKTLKRRAARWRRAALEITWRYRHGVKLTKTMEKFFMIACQSLDLLEIGARPQLVNDVASSMLYSDAVALEMGFLQ